MKIRSQFVSNSSSTSYIIALKKIENGVTMCCGMPIIDFAELMGIASRGSDWCGDSTEVKATGYDLTIKSFEHNLEENKQWYTEAEIKTKQDLIIYMKGFHKACPEDVFMSIQISYRDAIINHVFDTYVKKGIIKVFEETK